jgi:hypothetical protein
MGPQDDRFDRFSPLIRTYRRIQINAQVGHTIAVSHHIRDGGRTDARPLATVLPGCHEEASERISAQLKMADSRRRRE